MSRPSTILQRFYDQVNRFGATRPALKAKRGGAWQSWSWKQYGDEVGTACRAMEGHGLQAGDRIAILAANSPEWLFADMGAMAAGAVSTGIYPSDLPDQVQYILQHSEARFLFVDSMQQAAKTDTFRQSLPTLEAVVVFDPDADIPADSGLVSWQEFLQAGQAVYDSSPASVEEQARAWEEDRFCMMVYTSGTTGRPKGAMYTHKNLWFESNEVLPMLGGECMESISFLPLCHIAERLQAEIIAINAGNTVWFAESIEKLKDNLAEVRPTVLLCVPRLWEKFYAAMSAKFDEARGVKALLLRQTMQTGSKVAGYRAEGRMVPPVLAARWRILDKLVASKVKAQLGLDRCNSFVSGAAPLSKDIADFFSSLGMDILEVYGQTECVGILSANRPGSIRNGTVGQKLPGVEVKIAADGEILTRGDHVFPGYYKDPEATAETVINGWLHTGDIGEFDSDGFLRITDRKKDIIVTAGGKNIAPQNIENRLKLFPGISQSVVIGDKKKYLVALITLDPLAHEEIAKAAGLSNPPATHSALTSDPKVIALVQGYIDSLNAELAKYESVKEFKILDRDLSIEDGELTPTLKVKRRVVQKNHAALIDGMYPDD